MSDSLTSTPPHQELLDLGDPAQLEQIRQQFVYAVRRVCPRSLAEDAEDLVQEAMLKLVRMQERQADPSHLTKSYIKKVAYSIVVDELRRRQRRPEQGTAAGGEPNEVVDPQPVSSDAGLGDAIADCLQKQVPDRKRAVTLHLLGHTISEIAALLGCKVKSAENLIYRGMSQLRECLTAKGVYP